MTMLIPIVPSFGLTLAQAEPADIQTPKIELFSTEAQQPSSLEASQALGNYFGRIHQELEGIETTHIEKLVARLLRDVDPKLRTFVKRETILRDTLVQRFFEVKTPLGQVLQELEYSQESPNRALLPLLDFATFGSLSHAA